MKTKVQYEKRVYLILYFAKMIVSILGGAMFLFLFLYGLKETARFPRDYYEIIDFYPVAILKNILIMMVSILCIVGIGVFYQRFYGKLVSFKCKCRS